MKFLKRNLFPFLILASGLVILLLAQRGIQVWQGKAEKIPLEITVDGAYPKNLPRIWQNFAQGGEEKELMIDPVKNEVIQLKPQYIRIDHLFDFHNVLIRQADGQIVYRWQELDRRVEEILEVGALPFLSLSYLPLEIADGSITGKPNSFSDWQNLIQATIEHYSGPGGKNLANVYYEVWNEPDLFGKMTPQDYFSFYRSAEQGARNAGQTQPFRFGGPAITGMNKTWMNNFLNQVKNQNLRLDFISWHSYGTNPRKVELESKALDSLENYQPFKGKVEKIVTEWGPDSEINSLNDNYYAASHAIASVSQSLGAVDKLFTFELKDGLNPEGKQFWGRWGLLTHQKMGVVKKPRYQAINLLNQVLDFNLPATENQFNFYPLASTDGRGNYAILLTAYPYQGESGIRDLVLKINQFLPGEYNQTTTFLGPSQEVKPQTIRFTSKGTIYEKSFPLKSFSTLLLNLERLSATSTITAGRTENPSDKSARVIPPLPALIYPLFTNLAENQNGEIAFDFKPLWANEDTNQYYFWETRITPLNRIYALRRTSSEGIFLDFVFTSGENQKSISQEITSWQAGNWYRLSFSWDNPKMEFSLAVDDQQARDSLGVTSQIAPGKFVHIGSDFEGKNQVNGDIDNLEIKLNGQLLFGENFDQTE